MVLAYAFGVVVRLILLNQMSSVEAFWFEGRPIPIWSDDAGLYGFYAKELLRGVALPFEGDYILGYLIYGVVSLSGAHIDWVMFVLPALLASLVVIPMILIGHYLQMTRFAFFASLIGVIGINYYTRSYLGYIDTDSINLFLVGMLTVSMVALHEKKDIRYALIGIMAIFFLTHFYHSSKALIAGILAIYLLLSLLFFTKEKRHYQAFILFALAFVLSLKVPYITVVLLALPFVFHQEQKLSFKAYMGAVLFLVFGAVVFLDVSSFYLRVQEYFHADKLISIGEYKIVNILSTVAEDQKRGVFSIFESFVGIELYVLVATAGFIALSIRYRVFLVLLPLLVLGFLSSKIGIRFSMYATPVFAFGFLYVLYNLSEHFKQKSIVALGTFAGVLLMVVNINNLNQTLKPKYFQNEELVQLSKLELKNGDKILTWWDYGWPLWYYLGQNATYIDNGLNRGAGTLFMAKTLLSNSPKESYALSKVMSTDNKDIALFENDIEPIAKAISLKDKNVYLLLHRNMLLTFKAISQFSDTDIKSGELKGKRDLFISNLLRPYDKKSPLVYGDTFVFDLRTGQIRDKDGDTSRVYGALLTQNNKLVTGQRYDKNAKHVLIIYNNQKAIYLDRGTFNTFLIQALLLERFDKNLFSNILSSPNMKILKLNDEGAQ